jgi:deoxyribodipyrimidine photo-lyase
METSVTLVWFRRDLRLDDHPALAAAAARGRVACVYIDDGTVGAASQGWVEAALVDLRRSLAAFGVALIVQRGEPASLLPDLTQALQADAVFWTRPDGAAAGGDAKVHRALARRGIETRVFDGATLFPFGSILNGAGAAYRVFKPFMKVCWARSIAPPLAVPRRLLGVGQAGVLGTSTESRYLAGFRAVWEPGCTAEKRLASFLKNDLHLYEKQRDFPALAATSRLSPFLAFGQIGPRRVWATVQAFLARHKGCEAGAFAFLRQLLWREFCAHLLAAHPTLPFAPLDPSFAHLPWRRDKAALLAWQRGETGYPIVDAGMRQLAQTGWMPNRVRMIVGSFLVKDLLLPWQQGLAWFRDTLVDEDPANNAFGWQWVAGCGADAAPFGRVFNPVLQAKKFDPTGDYIRSFLPELKKIPLPYLAAPWQAPASVLTEAGVRLGRDYPRPIVAHDEARLRAKAAYARRKA